ncbi:MAG TPA: alanine racemase [Ktedonobacterales bacterium]|nr:alanine racemase [Ktedonobacterales bacterium]
MIYLNDFLRYTDGILHLQGRTDHFPAFAHDSRQVAPNELFIAVRGERRDGHEFIEDAIQQGAAGIVAESSRFSDLEARSPQMVSQLEQQGVALILVKDTRLALCDYARGILQQWHPHVIAVTGSVGKTSTKEAIATILESSFPTFKSWRNYNDLLGLPLSLGRLEPQHRYAVLEFGCDHPGEIAALCELTRPSLGVVTRISHTQLQYFGSVQRYAEELTTLPTSLPDSGFAILNGRQDAATLHMAEETPATPLLFSASTSAGRDAGATASTQDERVRVVCLGARQLATGLEAQLAFAPSSATAQQARIYQFSGLTGTHWIESILAAITTTMALGIDGHEAAALLERFTPLPGRSRLLPGIAESLLLDDTHNAPPAAVEAALQTLRDLKAQHPGSFTIAVLGDMLRLGAYEAEAHQQIGSAAAQSADFLVTLGQRAETIAAAARSTGMPTQSIAITYSAEDAAQMVQRHVEQSDARAIILIKGSEEMRMERVTERLLAQPEQAAQALDRQTLAWKQIIRMRPDRPTWVEIDLSAIGANCRRLKQIVGPGVELLASLKADAYGHGALRVARTVLYHGATRLGVATLSEAVPLRQAGITAPILVFGYLPLWQMREAVRLGITVTLYSLEAAQALSQAAQSLGIVARAHLKIDSGMGRLGLRAEQVDTIATLADEIHTLSGIELEGIFTHFACADSADQTLSLLQLERFQAVLAALEQRGLRPPIVHAANSAATLTLPESRFNMVRPGIALYGLHPSDEVRLPGGFQPALTFKTQIAQVKDIPAGECISYGCTFVTPTEMRIAVIPVGYADGFRRAPANWGEVLVRGKRAPLVGRVCMDQSMIDVSAIPGVTVGDEVVLIGQQAEEQLTAEAVAARLGTINYEVVSEILARVPRVN